jgi:uncharacterized Zn finger protein (UPF0148 family)
LSRTPKDVKHMAEVLKQGATLTEFACPACASPLFRFKSGELWCVKCDKRVVVVKEGESTERMVGQARLASLENTILEKIQMVEKKIREEESADELQKLNAVLSSLLESLEKLKKMKA